MAEGETGEACPKCGGTEMYESKSGRYVCWHCLWTGIMSKTVEV